MKETKLEHCQIWIASGERTVCVTCMIRTLKVLAGARNLKASKILRPLVFEEDDPVQKRGLTRFRERFIQLIRRRSIMLQESTLFLQQQMLLAH